MMNRLFGASADLIGGMPAEDSLGFVDVVKDANGPISSPTNTGSVGGATDDTLRLAPLAAPLISPAPEAGDLTANDDDFVLLGLEPLSGNLFDDNGNGADTAQDPAAVSIVEIDEAPFSGDDFTIGRGAIVSVGNDGSISVDALAYIGLGEGESEAVSFTYTITEGEAVIVPGEFEAVINVAQLTSEQGVVLVGNEAGAFSGISTSGVGDVNADGFDDVIVGAYLAGADNQGEAVVYFGGPEFGIEQPGTLRLVGGSANDLAGIDVRGAGDVNGDDIQDLIVGVYRVDPEGRVNAGATAVVYGSDDFGDTLDLSDLSINEGFLLFGAEASDFSGFSVSTAGDYNGDGVDDLIIGAWPADGEGGFETGETYVVFGQLADPASGEVFGREDVDLGALNGSNGFTITGDDADDRSGYSVSNAGDLNADGIDDIILGAIHADPSGRSSAGEAYVFFGNFGNEGSFSDLNTSDADLIIEGATEDDKLGRAVRLAGDVNGDDVDDIIVGSFETDVNGIERVGAAHVIFGGANVGGRIDAGALDGTNGFTVVGLAQNDLTGLSVSGAGDINADGFDDLVIGAHLSGDDDAGSAYVVFGQQGGFSPVLDLVSLDGTNGFRIDGRGELAYLGFSVSAAGDLNGDGIDDLAVGSFGVNEQAGETIIIYGRGTDLLETSQATVTLTFVGENDPVIANDDSFATGEDVSIPTANVLDNDTDVDENDVLTVVAVAGEASNVGASFATQAGGIWQIDSDGTITFDTNNSYETLGEGDTASEEINYTVSDGLTTSIANVTVQINGVNDAPVAVDDDVSVLSTGDVGFDVLQDNGNGADNDIDISSSLRISAINGSAFTGSMSFALASGATVLALESGFLTYQTDDAFSGLAPGASTVDSFTYTLIDDLGATSEATVNVTVTAPDASSTMAVDDIFTLGVSVGTLLTTVDANDIPTDNVTVISVNGETGVIGTTFELASGATVTMMQDGSFLYDPGTDFLPIGFEEITDRFSYTIDGGNGFTGALAEQVFNPADSTVRFNGPANDPFAASPLGSGFSVGNAGDVNNDGIDDIIIGQPTAMNDFGDSEAGAAYVVFGASNLDLGDVDLDALDGTDGFAITGYFSSQVGASVTGVGDVNGDGIDDLAVGSARQDEGIYGSRDVIVLFGRDSTAGDSFLDLDGNFNGTVDETEIYGSAGFILSSTDSYAGFGHDIASGDINGDGFSDIIIGSYRADYYPGSTYQGIGRVFVLFGANGSPLDGSAGGPNFGDIEALVDEDRALAIDTSFVSHSIGQSVDAGDVDGDGIDDLIFGSQYGYYEINSSGADPTGTGFVVFGTATLPGLNTPFGELPPGAGAELFRTADGTANGRDIAAIGDVNGDGIGDLAIVDPNADSLGNSSNGRAYVVFGVNGGIGAIDVDTLDGANGFIINFDSDSSGADFVAAAGDVNGDGFDDFVVASPDNYYNDPTDVYLILGHDNGFAAELNVFELNGVNGTAFRVDEFSDLASGDFNNDGFDDLLFGDGVTSGGIGGQSHIYFGNSDLGQSDLSAEVTITVFNDLAGSTGADEPVTGDFFVGFDDDDEIIGTSGNDTLDGAGGDDTLIGGDGSDVLIGGDGNDVLIAGSGSIGLSAAPAPVTNGADLVDTVSIGGGSGSGDPVQTVDADPVDTVDGSPVDTVDGDPVDTVGDDDGVEDRVLTVEALRAAFFDQGLDSFDPYDGSPPEVFDGSDPLAMALAASVFTDGII